MADDVGASKKTHIGFLLSKGTTRAHTGVRLTSGRSCGEEQDKRLSSTAEVQEAHNLTSGGFDSPGKHQATNAGDRVS